MDRWAWSHLAPWLELRRDLPIGRLFCIGRGPTQGRPCVPAEIRAQLHQTAIAAGVRRRFAPHQLRHAHAVEMSREGISLLVDPTPAWARRPRDHLPVSARHRQHRDHPGRASAARADDPSQQTTHAQPLTAPIVAGTRREAAVRCLTPPAPQQATARPVSRHALTGSNCCRMSKGVVRRATAGRPHDASSSHDTRAPASHRKR